MVFHQPSTGCVAFHLLLSKGYLVQSSSSKPCENYQRLLLNELEFINDTFSPEEKKRFIMLESHRYSLLDLAVLRCDISLIEKIVELAKISSMTQEEVNHFIEKAKTMLEKTMEEKIMCSKS